MAKANTGLIGVEGKLGDHIISRKGRYESYIRQVVSQAPRSMNLL